MDLQEYLSAKRRIVDAALNEYLPPEDRFPEVIYKAMRYGVQGGGKRLRPVLAIAACETVGGNAEQVLPAACAIECIHAFSLIHDDLPALDNDDLRRGKPTSHKVFGEAMAILAGDALLAWAFELLTGRTAGVPAERVLAVANDIAAATGTSGMIVGQVVDILCEGKKIDPETLAFMHKNKTGALIRVSLTTGAKLGGGSAEEIDTLASYGESIGLAFQIADDILDIESTSEKLGKPVGSDAANEKSTYPVLFGLDESKRLAREAVDKAISALATFGDTADPLRAIARFIIERDF